LFASQFALLSSGHTEEPDPEKLLFKESDYNYSFFASVFRFLSPSFSPSSQGRKYAKGMSVDISLVRRQDLITRAIDALAFPYHDKVTLQVFAVL
jgi:hypothetical protein